MDINGIVKLVCVIISLAVIALIVFRWFKRGCNRFEGVLWIALFAGFIYSTYLLLNTEINQAHDMISSMSRINDMADDIKNRTFPSIILTGQANGFGCAGILYPHFFYYIPSYVRYLGASTVCSYQVFVWFCQMLGSIVMFGSVKLILSCISMGNSDGTHEPIALNNAPLKESCIPDFPAIIATLLFICYPYRVADLYWRGALSESYAMMFIPLLIAAFMRIVVKGNAIKENGIFGCVNRDWIYLCLAITGLLQTHVLTLVMAVILGVILCFVFIKDVFRKDVIISVIVAMVAAIIINLWYIVPFLKFFTFGSNVDGMMYEMSYYGTTIPGLIRGISYDHSRPGIIGIVGFFILLIDIIYTVKVVKEKVHKNGVRKMIVFMTATSAASLYVSSKYFPWDLFQSIVPSVGIFQFPLRFILITCVLSVIVFALAVFDVLNNIGTTTFVKDGTGISAGIKKSVAMTYVVLVVTGVLLVMGAHNIFTCLDVTEELFDYSTNDFSFDYRIEYLPKGADSSHFADAMPYMSEGVNTLAYFKDSKQLAWQYETSVDGGYFQAPLMYYPGYNAVFLDNSGNLISTLATKKADNYRVQVDLPSGYASGVIIISYEGIWYFKYCSIISLIGILGFAIYLVVRKHNLYID